MRKNSSFIDLPTEMLLLILSFLDKTVWAQFRLTNHAFYNLSNDPIAIRCYLVLWFGYQYQLLDSLSPQKLLSDFLQSNRRANSLTIADSILKYGTTFKQPRLRKRWQQRLFRKNTVSPPQFTQAAALGDMATIILGLQQGLKPTSKVFNSLTSKHESALEAASLRGHASATAKLAKELLKIYPKFKVLSLHYWFQGEWLQRKIDAQLAPPHRVYSVAMRNAFSNGHGQTFILLMQINLRQGIHASNPFHKYIELVVNKNRTYIGMIKSELVELYQQAITNYVDSIKLFANTFNDLKRLCVLFQRHTLFSELMSHLINSTNDDTIQTLSNLFSQQKDMHLEPTDIDYACLLGDTEWFDILQRFNLPKTNKQPLISRSFFRMTPPQLAIKARQLAVLYKWAHCAQQTLTSKVETGALQATLANLAIFAMTDDYPAEYFQHIATLFNAGIINQHSVLHHVKDCKNPELMAILLAIPGVDPRARDANGHSVVHYVTHSLNPKVNANLLFKYWNTSPKAKPMTNSDSTTTLSLIPTKAIPLKPM